MRHDIVTDLVDSGAVAVIRVTDTGKLPRVVQAFREGGIHTIEITMTTPNALGVIERTAQRFSDDVRVGVGSVLDGTTARQAIQAGASFVVSPVLKAEIIETSHRYDVPAIPGTFTPSEVARAHELGADIVKVFPANVLGPGFLRALNGPMPHVKLLPTGGVSLRTAGQWLQAGACAVGVGSALLDEQALADERYQQLTENAEVLRATINEARREQST